MILRYLMAVVCVLGIAAGQILFKMSANGMRLSGGVLAPATLTPLIAAFALYGFTSLGWVWVLRELPLNRVYPLMALAFLLVPVASHFIFKDRLTLPYLAGSALIVLGVVLTLSSANATR